MSWNDRHVEKPQVYILIVLWLSQIKEKAETKVKIDKKETRTIEKRLYTTLAEHQA